MKYHMDVKQVLPGLYEITSETKPGSTYLVDKRVGALFHCTCKDHIIRGTEKCKHIKTVELSIFEKAVLR